MNTTGDMADAHHNQSVIERFRAWYFDGAGPRVRGAALRQRTVRTIAFAGILVLLIAAVHVCGGPWLSGDAIQNSMTGFGTSPLGTIPALLLFVLGFVLQFMVPVGAIGLLINGLGLAIVARRWRRWKQHH